jgi:hypothetical protein
MDVLDKYECIFDTYPFSNDVSVLKYRFVCRLRMTISERCPAGPAEPPVIKSFMNGAFSAPLLLKHP